MIRITTIFLCILLAAAAAGRYRAEVSVKETRAELGALQTNKSEGMRAIQILRAEVAYLENPDRLAKIAELNTDLRTSHSGQILSARQFASVINGNEFDQQPIAPYAPGDVITNAIAMAQLGGGR